MIRISLFSLLICFSTLALAEGVDLSGRYSKFAKRQDTGFGNDRVQVLGFFSYSCKPCEGLEEKLQQWKSKQSKKVVYEWLPSTFIVGGEQQARLYYTAEFFKAKPALHQGLYQTIQNNRLVLDQNDLLANFLGSRLKVDPFRVEVAMDSIAVNASLMYADDMSKKYRAGVLPMFIVNGRYITSLKQAGDEQTLFKVLDYLVAQELDGYRYSSW